MLPHAEGSNGKPRIKLPEPAFSDKDIWQGDLFGRAKYATTIRDMLADETEPLVVAVNGKWGCGKSFFLQRFAKEYERSDKGGVCIYLNAWESDYLSNPLLFLLSGINEAANESSQNKLFDAPAWLTAKKAVGKITKNMIGQIPWVGAGLKDVIETRPLEIYAEQTKLAKELKAHLLVQAEKIKNETGKPLILCVDELDRCRPTYTIEMLERIKHFFSIPGIVFMLGLDREQLSASIISVYGQIDTENYLHRFFDLEFVLPEPNREAFINAKLNEYGVEQYWRRLDSSKRTTLSFNEGALFKRALHLLAFAHRLELREIQTVLKWFAVLARSQNAGCFMCPYFAVVLIMLRLRHRRLYAKFVQGVATPTEILDFLLPPELLSDLERRDVYSFEEIVVAVYCSLARFNDDNPYLKELQDWVKKCRAEEKCPETWPKIIQKYSLGEINAMLQRVREKEIHYADFYNSEARQMLVSRLETFAWHG